VGGLGPKAVAMFNQGGVDVFVGATGTVKDAIDDWRAEMLCRADLDNACKDHKH
jgi:predicted Fe-Mo cluster-binding NifX family protein